jgi:hypothetical protein
VNKEKQKYVGLSVDASQSWGVWKKRLDATGDRVIGNWRDTLVSVHEQRLIDQAE